MESQFAQITQLFGMMSGSLGWENHFQGSSPRENAHDSLLTVAEIGSQSGLSSDWDTQWAECDNGTFSVSVSVTFPK